MRRIVLPILGVLLLGAAFTAGLFLGRNQPAPAPAASTPPPAAAQPPAPAPEPVVVIEPDDLATRLVAMSGWSAGFRYHGGPVTFRVRRFIDYTKDGVRKRACFHAVDIEPLSPRSFPDYVWREAKLFPSGFAEMSQSDGLVVIGDDTQSATVNYSLRYQLEKGSLVSADREGRFFGPENPLLGDSPIPVSNYDDLAKGPGYCHEFQPLTFLGGSSHENWEKRLKAGEEVPLYWSNRRTQYDRADSQSVVLLTAEAWPTKLAATGETIRQEAAEARKAADAAPEDAEAWRRLARALENLLSLPPTVQGVEGEERGRLTEEGVAAARQAMKFAPDKVRNRDLLQGLLFRLAYARNQGDAAGQAPALIDEALALGPPDYDFCLDAAMFYRDWKNPELQKKDLPADKRKQLEGDQNRRIVELLRRGVEPYQGFPDFVKERLRRYEAASADWPHANTDEYRKLIADMKGWAQPKGK